MSPRKSKKQLNTTEASSSSTFTAPVNLIDWETKFNDAEAKYNEYKNKYDALLVEYDKLNKRYIKTRKHLAEGEGKR